MRCLLLNASYEPLAIITDRDAVCAYLDGELEVVEYSDQVMRSPSTTVMVPSVARLKRYVNVPRGMMKSVMLTSRAVRARDNHTCSYCLGHATTMDHVVPRGRGGPHTWENVVASCRKCNAKKGMRSLEELGWTLHTKPFRPHGVSARILSLRPDPAWRPYLGLQPEHTVL